MHRRSYQAGLPRHGAAGGIRQLNVKLLHAPRARVVAGDIGLAAVDIDSDSLLPIIADVTLEGSVGKNFAPAEERLGKLGSHKASTPARSPFDRLPLADGSFRLNTVYNAAFGSKDAFYREATDHYRTKIGGFVVRALDEESNALEAIARLLRDAATSFARTNGTPGCMIATPSTGTTKRDLVLLGRDLRTSSVEMVAAPLERGVVEGQVHAQTDCVAWSRYVGTLVRGMSVQARDGATADALLATVEIALQLLSPATVDSIGSPFRHITGFWDLSHPPELDHLRKCSLRPRAAVYR